MSGVDLDGRRIRKGAAESVKAWVLSKGGTYPRTGRGRGGRIARAGGTPLVVAENNRVLGSFCSRTL
jgi:K+-transporting ATPase ATPase B chain